MSVSKDKQRNTWKVYLRYKDWQGVQQVHTKRGFATKKEGQEYEREFLQKKSKDVNMGFNAFIDIYLADKKPRLKLNTYLTKEHIINSKIRPFFMNKNLSEINATDVIQWQNELLNRRDKEGKTYSPVYLRTVQNQLSAIFNHACRFYELKDNPSRKAGKIGKAKSKEMLFWTKEEYLKFSEAMKSKPISYYAFEVLYFTGIRLGELLALCRKDIDLKAQTLSVNKSYQRIKKKDYVTDPKTEGSRRVIQLPKFLCDELEDYFGMIYGCHDETRLFEKTKSYIHNEMQRGCDETGVKRIRIHDLRHSHVALCIELGYSTVAIAERLGHESISVTYRYAHLYPSKQIDLAKKITRNEVQNDEHSI